MVFHFLTFLGVSGNGRAYRVFTGLGWVVVVVFYSAVLTRIHRIFSLDGMVTQGWACFCLPPVRTVSNLVPMDFFEDSAGASKNPTFLVASIGFSTAARPLPHLLLPRLIHLTWNTTWKSAPLLSRWLFLSFSLLLEEWLAGDTKAKTNPLGNNRLGRVFRTVMRAQLETI